MKRYLFIRRVTTENYLETFLISAIAAILLIRLFLKITGYPHFGGSHFHIAHVFWGGLLMLAAIVVAFSFIGQEMLRLVSILGGVGFGTFIDEMGKFVTHDNDYFFKPSVAFIYIILIFIFFSVRTFFRKTPLSQEEYLLNAVERFEEVELNDLDEAEKEKVLSYLRKCDPTHALVGALKNLVNQMNLVPVPEPNILKRMELRMRGWYRRVRQVAGFEKTIVLFFLLQLILTVLTSLVLVFFHGLGIEQILDVRILGRVARQFQQLAFIDWAHLGSSWFSALCIILGIFRIRKNRLGAFRMFERSILASIFLTQIFAFYKEQFLALVGLLMNILIWIGLRYITEREVLRIRGD